MFSIAEISSDRRARACTCALARARVRPRLALGHRRDRSRHAEAKVQLARHRRRVRHASRQGKRRLAREHLRLGRQAHALTQVHAIRRRHGERRGGEDHRADGVRRAVSHHVVRARAQGGPALQVQREASHASPRQEAQRRGTDGSRPSGGVHVRRGGDGASPGAGAVRAGEHHPVRQGLAHTHTLKAAQRRRTRTGAARQPSLPKG